MSWMKVDGARAYMGGFSRRTIYEAIRRGELRAARIGAGRNVVTCTEWCDDYLKRRAEALVPREVSPARLRRA
jgi:excisionase family DNA binding protein